LESEAIQYEKSDVAHIVKTFYPDIRKVLNNVQACINNNTLSIEGRSFTKSNYVKEIVDLAFSKDKDAFNKIRQIVADNSVRDFTDIYRGLYDATSSPAHIIVIAEGIHNSATSMDREITFMSTIAKLQ
jgi:hypothetical protein